jgi:hypothetical protein
MISIRDDWKSPTLHANPNANNFLCRQFTGLDERAGNVTTRNKGARTRYGMQKTYEFDGCDETMHQSQDGPFLITFSAAEQSMHGKKGGICSIVRKHLHANSFENAKP